MVRKSRSNIAKNKKTRGARPAARAAAVVPRGPGFPALSPYAHCVLSGTAHQSSNYGYPDGDFRPSITRDFRFVYTIKPSASGNVRFILAPSANGCINIVEGAAQNAKRYIRATASVVGFSQTGTISTGTGQLIEDMSQPILASTGVTPMPVTDFRPIAVVADCVFTGSSMMNNGSVTITKMQNSEFSLGTETVDAATDYAMDRVKFASVNFSTILPSTEIMPAKRSFTIRSVPVQPKYEPTQASVSLMLDGGGQTYFRAYTEEGGAFAQLTPSYHPACPWTMVGYAGLDPSASITVTVRYCQQVVIGADDAAAPLARPSPVEEPGYLARVAGFIASSPLTTAIGNGAQSLLIKAGGALARGAVNAVAPAFSRLALSSH